MTQEVRIAKKGKSAYSSNPNDFIFHSAYNTFKILLEDTKDAVIPGGSSSYEVSVAHGLEFVPIVTAFVNLDSSTQVFTLGGGNVSLFDAEGGITYNIELVKVKSDATNINFYFDSNAGDKTVHIRYFCLEGI